MTSFGWKKKTSILKRNSGLEEDADPDFITGPSPAKVEKRETPREIVVRLKDEGFKFVEREEFWKATSRFQQAVRIIQNDLRGQNDVPPVHEFQEMAAQCLIQLHEWEPAIDIAGLAVKSSHHHWEPAFQTLGRAYLGIGDVEGAVAAFSRARLLNPADDELRVQDLAWAQKLKIHLKIIEAGRRRHDPAV